MTAMLLGETTTNGAGAIPEFGELFIRMLVILGGLLVASVLLLKVGLPRLLRHRARGRSELIEVIETHRLESRKTVYLLRVGRQYYLVGACDGHMTTLAGEPLDNDAVAEAVAGSSFDDVPIEQVVTRERRAHASSHGE